MTPFRRLSLLCAGLFFAGGIIWGLKGGPFSRLGDQTPLSMICKKDWISDQTLNEVEQRLNVSIERVDFDQWSEYSRLLANDQGQFDLVCAHSFLAGDLSQSNWLDEFDYSTLEAYRGIAPEFKGLPFDREEKHFLPLGWQINAYSFKKDSKTSSRWDHLWPSKAKKISMNYPDLELYVRMKDEGFEMDPDKQGRYNRDPEAEVEQFLKSLGHLQKPTKVITKEDFESDGVFQTTNKQIGQVLSSDFAELKTLEDGSSIWFLLVGIGKNSAHKDLAREVLNELLSPSSSDSLRKQNGFAHVLSHFNDVSETPSEMKATFLRHFPLSSLRFPEISLEGLPQWETFVTKNLEGKDSSKKMD